MSIGKGIGRMYRATGILMFALGVLSLIRIILSVESLPAKFIHMCKEILSGTNTHDYMNFLAGVFNIFFGISIGLILILIGDGFTRQKYEMPKINRMYTFIVMFLISLELWRLFVYGMVDTVIDTVPLAFILSFMFIQAKYHEGAPPKTYTRGAISKLRIIYGLLIVMSIVLLGKFVVVVYTAHMYAGELIEYFQYRI